MAVNGAEWSGPLPAPFSLLQGKNIGTYLTEDQVGPRGSPGVLEKEKHLSLVNNRALDHPAHRICTIRDVNPSGRIAVWIEHFWYY